MQTNQFFDLRKKSFAVVGFTKINYICFEGKDLEIKVKIFEYLQKKRFLSVKIQLQKSQRLLQ